MARATTQPSTGASTLRPALAAFLAATLLVPRAGAFGNVGEPADCSCPVLTPPAFVVDPGWGTHVCARSQRWGVAVCAASVVSNAGDELVGAAAYSALLAGAHGAAHASALGQHEHLIVPSHPTAADAIDYLAFEKAARPASAQTARAEQRARAGRVGAPGSGAAAGPLGPEALLRRELAIEKALEARPQLSVELGRELEALADADAAEPLAPSFRPLLGSAADGGGADGRSPREKMADALDEARERTAGLRAALEKALQAAGTTTVRVLGMTALPSPAGSAASAPDAYPLVSLRARLPDGSHPEVACALANYAGSAGAVAASQPRSASPSYSPAVEYVCPLALRPMDIVKVVAMHTKGAGAGADQTQPADERLIAFQVRALAARSGPPGRPRPPAPPSGSSRAPKSFLFRNYKTHTPKTSRPDPPAVHVVWRAARDLPQRAAQRLACRLRDQRGRRDARRGRRARVRARRARAGAAPDHDGCARARGAASGGQRRPRRGHAHAALRVDLRGAGAAAAARLVRGAHSRALAARASTPLAASSSRP